MSDLKFNDVNLVIIDPRRHLRNSLRLAFNVAGVQYDNAILDADVHIVRRTVQDTLGPDILICDADAKGGDPFRLIREIRNNEIGQNPFFAIMLLSWDPTQALVKRAVNCGADFLIAAPFSPKLIFDRIRALVEKRAPFVVTSDYVGPDRRNEIRRDSTATRIEVPNSLREKTLGTYDESVFRQKVDFAISTVKSRKIEHQAYKLADDAESVAAAFARDPFSIDPDFLVRLQKRACDLRTRAQTVSMLSLDELCEALFQVVRSVWRNPADGMGKDIQLMQHLAMAIRAAVEPEDLASPVAYDIAEAVSSR